MNIKQLDELEKHVVPQFVADWYEDNKDGFEFNLYILCLDYNNCEVDKKLSDWFCDKHNKPLETLVNMHQFGYEVEKEKLYKVSLKKNGIGIGVQRQDGSLKERFAKEELSEYGFDNLDVYEVEEVEHEH